jgi:DNA invertase Pin-like site-specific DNA recombinase
MFDEEIAGDLDLAEAAKDYRRLEVDAAAIKCACDQFWKRRGIKPTEEAFFNRSENRGGWTQGRNLEPKPKRKPRAYQPAGPGRTHKKLTVEQAEDIRKLYASGRKTQRQIAREMGLSQGLVNQIILRKKYDPDRPEGKAGGQRKLNDEQVREIRALVAERTSHRVIAERFGCQPSTIYRIAKGINYKDVT